MTGRQKIEAALSSGGTAEIPAVICYEGIYVRDHWDALTNCPWWFEFSPDLAQQLAWRREVIANTPQDWFCVPACPSREDREATTIWERPDGIYRLDRRTGRADRLLPPVVAGWNPEGNLQSVRPEGLPETIAQVDASIPPAGDFEADAFVADGHADLARAMLEEFGERLFPMAHANGPLWGCYGLWGFEGMMLMIADRPDLVVRACQRQLAHSLRRVRVAAALGAAGIWIEDCLTDMISTRAYAALNAPSLRALVAEIRRLGMKSIYYFCGNPAAKWDEVFGLGADAVALEEGKKSFDIPIEQVVERAGGGCSVLGNLDAVGVLQNAGEDQLRREVARQIAAGRRNGSRFVMSLGSPVTPSTPPERVRLYLHLAHALGRR